MGGGGVGEHAAGFGSSAGGGVDQHGFLDAGSDRVERTGEPRIPVLEQEVDGGDTIAEVHQQVPGGLGSPCTGRVRRHLGQMCPAGTVLDRDQRVDPLEGHGVHVRNPPPGRPWLAR